MKGEVEEIRFIGIRKTEDWVIRKLLTFSEGDQFSDEEGHRSWRRLNESKYFRQVGLFPQPGSRQGTVLIIIPLKEHKADFKSSFTSGYEPIYGLYGAARAWLINPFGRGRRLLINVSGSEKQFTGSMEFTHPWVGQSDVDLAFNLMYYLAEERLFPYEPDESIQGIYTETRYSAGVTARREWGSIFSTSFGAELEELFLESFDEYFSDEMDGLSGWARLVAISQEVTWDWRTKATKGWTLSFNIRESLSFLGSSFDYFTVSTSSSRGFEFPGNHTLSFSADCEYSFGETIPLHELSHFGEENSLKGFAARSRDQKGGTRNAGLQVVYGTPLLDWWSFWENHGSISLFASLGHAWDGAFPELDEFHGAWGIESGLGFEGYGKIKFEFAQNGSLRFWLEIGDPSMFTYFNYLNPGR